LSGKLIRVDGLNVHNIPTDSFAYISCDDNPSAYPGYLTPSVVLSFALAGAGSSKIFPQAIILYSEQAQHCNFTIQNDPPVHAIFTTINPVVAAGIAQLQLSDSSPGTTKIEPDLNSYSSDNGSSGAGGGFNGNGFLGGPSPTTAVAMIILYSITGIITALFIIIIVTGAVRAHRHPERYGPRAGAAGRAGQSRAKGIARAMLATLPIVKFGDQEPIPPKPSAADRDIELNALEPKPDQTEANTSASGAVKEPQTAAGDEISPQKRANGENESENPVEGAEVAGHVHGNNADGTQEDGTLGCSICTEDFNRGEEVRVLPCNHKFHPECVDPWLLNVSGTCPLCRIDLRPAATGGEEAENGHATTEDGNAALPPPLGMDQPPVDIANDFGPVRRESMPSLIHMRNATNPQERIAALRHLRNASRMLPQGDASTASRQSVTSRLRDRFRIRTTRAREPSVDDTEEERRDPEVRRLNPLILTGIPMPAAPAQGSAAAELRPLREVYRFGRRRS
jgi:Ring finger domain